MCLAVPAQILEIRPDGLAVADHAGNRRQISLQLLDDVQVGEYVIIHAGFAIHKIDEAAAQEALDYFKTLGAELPSDY